MPGTGLELHPDRFLPVEPTVRALARELYRAVAERPILSPHGHVDASVLYEDHPFADPAGLLVTPDHYVTRLLHADGVALADLGVGAGPLDEGASRAVWRRLCERWNVLAGTPVRAWLEAELVGIFGVDRRPSAETADAIWDRVAACLADPAYRPRALYRRFGISVLATTDDPCDDLDAHRALAADPTWEGRVIPTFRPDRYLEAGRPGWPAAVRLLGEVAGADTGHLGGWLEAMARRREAFVAAGATSSDHSHLDVGTELLDEEEAGRIYREALGGKASPDAAVALRRHLLGEMARMSCDDGLVMTLHPGIRRDHHRPTADRYGSDTGHDIPVRLELTEALRPLLERYGTVPGFHLIVFTVDETVWSRELAPLAGFYPSVYAGVPWWFLDAPEAMRRFRAAVTETAGWTRTSGFVDDTRAFCSIPARHDLARRIDAGVLARHVAEHRLDLDEAREIAVDQVTTRPVEAWKL